MSKERGSSAFAWGFILGAVGASVYTLMKTPRSGEEMMNRLKDQVQTVFGSRDPAADTAWQDWNSQVGRSMEDTVDDLKDAADDVKHETRRAVKQTGRQVEDWAEEAKDKVKDAVKETERQVDDLASEMHDQAKDAVKQTQREIEDLADAVEDKLNA